MFVKKSLRFLPSLIMAQICMANIVCLEFVARRFHSRQQIKFKVRSPVLDNAPLVQDQPFKHTTSNKKIN